MKLFAFILVLVLMTFEVNAQNVEVYAVELQNEQVVLLSTKERCLQNYLSSQKFNAAMLVNGKTNDTMYACWRPSNGMDSVIVVYDDGEWLTYAAEELVPVR